MNQLSDNLRSNQTPPKPPPPPSSFLSMMLSHDLFYMIILFSISSLLLHHLPLSSAASPHHFEGFDADEAEETPNSHTLLPSPSPPTTTLSPPAPPPPPHHNPHLQESSKSSSSSPFEYWDEDEFEGLPSPSPPTQSVPSEILEKLDADNESGLDSFTDLNDGLSENLHKGVWFYYVEIISVLFLVMFLINYFSGKKENEKLALAWAMKFAAKDSIFDKNFSLLGVGEGDDSPLLLKEGQSSFKFYASGRRFCQGLVATLELKSRHDLISRMYDVVVPCKDEVTIEVFMNDDAMDHVVFVLARKKMAKTMQREVSDLQRFAGLMAPISGRKWVADELAVIGESKEVAGDMITEAVLDQVFGDKAFEKLGKYFISMHFSDQHLGSHKKMLIFKFAMPNVNHIADMTPLVALVPYYIDLIGRYKLSSHARSKTEAARQKVAQEIHKELLSARQEDMKKRKAEQRKKLEEAEAQLSAEFVRKREAKERARQMKKAVPKMKMTRN
ncbi:hypothetical protein Leryth_013975 [Lithospermum erythrorhizon]|nr:hypothetical protein Leryth_013975 [Lithospermum erythrorhizon]